MNDQANDGIDGITEDQLTRFLALVEAVRAKDALARSGATDDGKQREATFGFEVISALMGRNKPEGNSFARTLAKVERSTRSLKVFLIDPIDKNPQPAKKGMVIKIRVSDIQEPVSAEVGDNGVVSLTDINDTQEIASLVVHDQDGHPTAVAGRIKALSAPKTRE